MRDTDRTPYAPGTEGADVSVRLYDQVEGGTLVWGPQLFTGVPFVDGQFNLIIGPTDSSTARLPLLEAFESGPRYLEVEVDGNTIRPRQRIASSPFAIRAHTAERAITAQEAMRADNAVTAERAAQADLAAQATRAESAATADHADFATTAASLEGSSIVIDVATGNVGIKNNTPQADLDVPGTIRAGKFQGDGSDLTGVQPNLPKNFELVFEKHVDGFNLKYVDTKRIRIDTGAISLFGRREDGPRFEVFEMPGNTEHDIQTARNNPTPGTARPLAWFEIVATADSVDSGIVEIVSFTPDGFAHLDEYAFSRTIGWVRTDQNGNIQPFAQYGTGRDKTYIWGKDSRVIDNAEIVEAGQWREVKAGGFVPPGSKIIHVTYETGNAEFRIRPVNRNALQMLWSATTGQVGENSGWIEVGDQRAFQVGPTNAKRDSIHMLRINGFKHFL